MLVPEQLGQNLRAGLVGEAGVLEHNALVSHLFET
jgi:hypothetical protein